MPATASNNIGNQGIVFVDTIGMIVFTPTTPSPLQFSIPKEIFSDMEIIDEDKLIAFVKDIFISNSQILTAFNGVLLLSTNLIFEKSFVSPVTPQTQQEVDGFLDHVPFQQVATVIVEGADSKVIAANKNLINSFVRAFEENGSIMNFVLPAYFLGLDASSIVNLNRLSLDQTIRKTSSLRQYSFSTYEPVKPRPVQAHATAPVKEVSEFEVRRTDNKSDKSKEKTRLFALIGVFTVLLIILAVVAITML